MGVLHHLFRGFGKGIEGLLVQQVLDAPSDRPATRTMAAAAQDSAGDLADAAAAIEAGGISLLDLMVEDPELQRRRTALESKFRSLGNIRKVLAGFGSS